MLSYNEVLAKDTVVELIDSGSIFNTHLRDLYQLPDKYKYEALVSGIFFNNKIYLMIEICSCSVYLKVHYTLFNTLNVDDASACAHLFSCVNHRLIDIGV